MDQDRRRSYRVPFIADVELFDESSGSRMSTRISDLSLNGCYVDTINPLPDGSCVQLRIMAQSRSFNSPATVVFSHTHLGMGLEFREVSLTSAAVLNSWLPTSANSASGSA